jgi:hypothetical protein
MPNGNVLALLLIATLMCAAAHAMHGWYGVAMALAGISLGVLALALWTACEGG